MSTKSTNIRQEPNRSYQQQHSENHHASEISIQQQSTPSRRDSQSSSYAYKETDSRSSFDYSSSIWHQKQQHPQQHEQQHSWGSIDNNRTSYPNNISHMTCSNPTQTFQNSRPFYMQFNPYIAQRALIASHNQQLQQHSQDQNGTQSNVRFGDYDYPLR